MAVTIGALVLVVLAAVLGLVAVEGRERAISEREDAHRQLIDAQSDLDSGFASTALLLAGSPGVPPPGVTPPAGAGQGRDEPGSGPPPAAVPPPPPQLIAAVEQVRQVVEQVEDTSEGLERKAAAKALAGLQDIQSVIASMPQGGGDEGERIREGATAVGRATVRIERLRDVQARGISRQRDGLASLMRWYAIGMAGTVLAVCLAVALTWLAVSRSRDRGVEELEASARRLADLAVTDPLTLLPTNASFSSSLMPR